MTRTDASTTVRGTPLVFGLTAAVIVLLLDQTTKAWALSSL